MLDTFLYRWRSLTRNQQLIMAGIAALLLFGLLSGRGIFYPPRMLAMVVIIFFAFPIHEYAHALTAVSLGDDTPRRQGRLTLDPRAHLDIWGTILLVLAGFGWAKPVEWNPRNVRVSRRAATILIAAAGPLSNLLMAFIAYLLIGIFNASGFFANFLDLFATINVYLCVFNFIPIPPLDGSHVLFELLPGDHYRLRHQLGQYGFLILFVILLVAPGIVTGPAMALIALLSGIANLLV